MLRLGRKPAKFTRRMMLGALVMAPMFDALGTPPVVANDYIGAVNVPWGMMLNDQLGCCVCADTGHSLMLRTANQGGVVVPTDDDILKLYETVGHYDPSDSSTDQGCVETDMLSYLTDTGFLGHKADATAGVNSTDLDHIRWTIQLFGDCRIGFNVPQSCMDQFNAGQPWDDVGDTNMIGGHDVPLVHYDGDFFYAVTWGQLQKVTPRFLQNQNYLEEAHAELFFDWVSAQGMAPSGFDLTDLASKLAALA